MSAWADARPSSRYDDESSLDDKSEKENENDGHGKSSSKNEWNSAKPAGSNSDDDGKVAPKKSANPPKNAPSGGPPSGTNNMQNSKAVINKLRSSQELKLKKDRKPAYVERDEQNIDDSLIDASEIDENERRQAGDLDDSEVVIHPLIPVSRRREDGEEGSSDESDVFELEQERQRFARKLEEGKGSDSDNNEGEGKEQQDERILSQVSGASLKSMPFL